MKRSTSIAAGFAVTASLLAVPSVASANNAHVFCSKSSSEADVLVSTNSTTARRYVVKPGQCHYGDWMYVSTGTDAVLADVTWHAGWHYQAGLSGTSVRVVRK